jgi:hypothetical protein
MPDHDSHHGYIASKDDYLKRLRRIEGQARGLQKMIEEEQYCIDILTQGVGNDARAPIGRSRSA